MLARDTLKIAVVGDIDPATLGAMLDHVFGALPAKAELRADRTRSSRRCRRPRVNVTLDVPQTVVLLRRRPASRATIRIS